MTRSPIDLSNRTDLSALVELIAAIRKKWPDGELLLVGATARDFLLSYAHGIRIERATLDHDFAVAVADWKEFEELRNALLSDGTFTEEKGVLYRLIFQPKGTKLDLIPFGGVERSDRTIAWPPDENEVLRVIGYREAMGDAILVHLPEDQQINVVSLPALTMLKLFAWKDRRLSSPGKDAADLWTIISSYPEAGNEARIYSEAEALLARENYDHSRTGAWILGKDIRELLSQTDDDSALNSTIELLEIEVDENGDLYLARDMRRAEAQQAYDLLAALYAGLIGKGFP
jgi:predicted nucleotidyltransferase